MVKSLIRGLSKWPTADLAELLLAIKGILDKRAEHARETAHRAADADRGKRTRAKGDAK